MLPATTPKLSRRGLLCTSAMLTLAYLITPASARSIKGQMLWFPDTSIPPMPVDPTDGVWTYFSPAEAKAIEAIVSILIPEDDLSPSGKEAGCAIFIDRQLSGEYGQAAWRYKDGPFEDGTPQQWIQSKLTPADQYRIGLLALDQYCRSTAGRVFADLDTVAATAVLKDFEAGKIEVPGANAKAVFDLILENTMEGFFSDPIYGGNREMAGWKMIGFPGARYDYRDVLDQHGKTYPKPPVSIMEHMGTR